MPADRKLIVRDNGRDREVLLVGTVTVGRSPTCEISSADPLLSRNHAQFDAVGNDVVVRDLNSQNGTFVNGVAITEHHLAAGDVVKVGPLEIELVITERPAAEQKWPDDDNEATVMRPRAELLNAPAAAAPAAAHGAPALPATPAQGGPMQASADDDDDAPTMMVARPKKSRAPVAPPPPAPQPSSAARAPQAPRTPQTSHVPHTPAAAAVPAFEPTVAARPAELKFDRALLLWVVPLALLSFLAGLIPDLLQSDQRTPLLQAHYAELAAGAADLVRVSGTNALPIDTVAIAMRNRPGVINARIVSPDGRVLAPMAEAGTSVPIAELSGSAPRVADASDGLVDIHVPAATADGRAVVIALSVNPERIHPAPTGSVVPTLLLVMCLGASYLVARQLTSVTDARLSRLGEEVELMTTGHVKSSEDSFALPGSRRIIDAVAFALSPAGRRTSNDNAPVARAYATASAGPSAGARLDVDTAFRVVQADAGCETLLGLKPAAAIGKHLIDALNDQAVTDEALRLLALAMADQPARGEVPAAEGRPRLEIGVHRTGVGAPLTILFERL